MTARDASLLISLVDQERSDIAGCPIGHNPETFVVSEIDGNVQIRPNRPYKSADNPFVHYRSFSFSLSLFQVLVILHSIPLKSNPGIPSKLLIMHLTLPALLLALLSLAHAQSQVLDAKPPGITVHHDSPYGGRCATYETPCHENGKHQCDCFGRDIVRIFKACGSWGALLTWCITRICVMASNGFLRRVVGSGGAITMMGPSVNKEIQRTW